MSMTNTETIQSLIDSGEGYNVEFKVRVPSKVRELTEEICAFANADGGYLLIGVDDNDRLLVQVWKMTNVQPFKALSVKYLQLSIVICMR